MSEIRYTGLEKLLILIACLLCFNGIATAQQYYFKHYQVEEGLSNNAVFCSLQDKNGFMWFGTKDGLDRFDGYNFKVFHNDPNDSLSISNNVIYRLYEAPDSTLWVGTKEGLYAYNNKKESFRAVKSTVGKEINSIQADHQNNLWFIANLDLYRLNLKTQALTVFPQKKYFAATSICISPSGELWVATANGFLEKYNRHSNSFSAYSVFNKHKDLASRWIEKIYATQLGSILVGTSAQGIKLFDLNNKTYKNLVTYNADSTKIYARDFIEKNREKYWAATESGIFILNLQKDTYTHIRKKFDDPYSLSDNAVYSLCKDNEGGIWATTYFGGINYYSNQNISFDKFFPDGSDSTISGDAVRGIVQDKFGKLWIGTEDAGLNKYFPRTGQFRHFKPNGSKSSISYSNIQCLLITGNDLWIGTYDHGLDVMNVKTNKVIRHYEHSVRHPMSFQSNFITSLYQTTNGNILAGTWSGLYQYEKDKDKFSAVSYIPLTTHVSSIYQDNRNIIWVSTLGSGTYTYDRETGTSRHYVYQAADSNCISSNSINSIFQDDKGNMWFATEGGGLCEMNYTSKRIKRYSVSDSLPSDFIFEILEDKQSNLWISTTKGLVRFDPDSDIMQVYTKSNGLLTNQFNYNAAFAERNQKFYFGSVRGLISFNPLSFNKTSPAIPVYITGMQLYNKEINIRQKNAPIRQSILFTHKITLRHNQSTFSLDFAALSYSAPGMTEYKYKMSGLDPDWTYLKTNRKAYFTELSPGDYVFEVKAAVNGIWDDQIKKLHIVILPPFYETRLAYIFYILFILLIIYLIVKAYHKRVENRNKRKIAFLEHLKEKEIYEAKIEFFTHIAHEIRTPLTLIKGPMEKVIRKAGIIPEIKNNLKIMERNTERLIGLTNQLLDFRKTEAKGYSLNFVRINISEHIREVAISFQPLIEKKNIDFQLDIGDKNIYAYVDIEAFNKMLVNLIDNAVKYAASTIILSLYISPQDESVFSVEAKNDGYVIPYEMKEKIFEPFFRLKETQKERGTGIGLPLSRSLAELHKGILDLKMPQNGQNIFILTLPIHQEKEFDLFGEPSAEETGVPLATEKNDNIFKPTILIVDDNEEIVDFIAEELIDQYGILKAYSGNEALERIGVENIQLIICDVMMPVMDGFELVRKIKTNFDHSHIPVILLTAKNTLQSKIEGLEVGADAYIEKPFSPEYLRVQINNLLANRNKIKEHFVNSPLAYIKSIAHSKADEQFLEALNEAIQHHIESPELDVEQLAKEMNMSRPTLYRKIKAISNLTPNELINLTRLKKAAELIAEGSYKIYEVAFMVGYTTQSNFSRSFTVQFGMSPSEYARTKRSTKA